MIPLQLILKNFMCYRGNHPPLDLATIRVACLCGNNGHGKTALLDAMTWALWGKARARQDRNGRINAPSQEELIYQGEQDMMVELEFSAREQHYRVNRRHSRSSRSGHGTTLLELQISSGNEFIPITGDSIRETETRICNLLHMDYQTFVNTAYLLQGQADLFTRSTPTKRKEMLAEVLNLSDYDKLEELAKEKSRNIRNSVQNIDSAIALRKGEIDETKTYKIELKSIKTSLVDITPRTETKRLRVDELRTTIESLESSRIELAELTKRLPARKDEVANLYLQVESHKTKITNFETILASRSEIKDRFRELEATGKHLIHLEQASFKFHELDQKRALLKSEIAVKHERISGQITQIQHAISNDMEPKVRRIPEIERQSRESLSNQTILDKIDYQLQHKKGEIQTILAKINYIDEANSDLKRDMEETRHKFDMLDHGKALCPLCKKLLGTDGQKHLRLEYEAQGQESKFQFQKNIVDQKELKRQHRDFSVQVSTQEQELGQEQRDLQAQIVDLNRSLEEALNKQSQLPPALTELATLELSLKNNTFADREQRKLIQLNADVESLKYDPKDHTLAQHRSKELEKFGNLHQKLLEATKSLQGEIKGLETTHKLLVRGQNDIREIHRRIKSLKEKLQSLSSLQNEYAKTQSGLRTLEQQRQSDLVRLGILENQLDRVNRLSIELRENEERRRNLIEESEVYNELSIAFSKNGIQALIIETAIPQLQGEANSLLGQLTEQRMTLKLQLEKGRKIGGLASEELQILISDEIGTRSYETFSGGESFRVDFALRIALSKLLAHRSGAPLPTLFIDEGFGSQDAVGQELLKQAIHAIQADFEKILVITHVEEVKEAFPTRIEVTKTDDGSYFTVV